MILDKIIETKKEELRELKKQTSLSALIESVKKLAPCRNFQESLVSKDCGVIAEVKCASPSRGRLIDDFNYLHIAETYEQNGAAAISVLTDEKYFCGHNNYLTQIKQKISVPVLRKDFIVDLFQVYETRVIGADAILLIVRILGDELKKFIILAEQLGLDALVEVHTQDELALALTAEAKIIGINNRNLDTFITDINTSRKLRKLIPQGKVVIAESGINTNNDITLLMKSGINYFLIGEALITASDIGKKLRELNGGRKV